MDEFISPSAMATIGPWQTNKLASVKVVSSRINPVDTAEIVIPIEGIGAGDFAKGMMVEVLLGYREKGLWPAFSGRVADTSFGRTATIYGRDSMDDLRQIIITRSFVDAVPQDIIQYALAQAGITNFLLTTKLLPRRHHFIARGITVIQLLKLVNRTWGLTWAFYFEPDGQFYWGPWEESSRYNNGEAVAQLEYGKNLLELIPSDHETGTLKTFSLPFIRHSHLLLLKDSRYWSRAVLVRVERVTYSHGEKRTEMDMEWRILQS